MRLRKQKKDFGRDYLKDKKRDYNRKNEKGENSMIKDKEKRKWLGVVFVLKDDYVSSLDDVEFKELKPIFEQLQLDVLTREDGPFPIGSEERKNVCEQNDIVLEELFDRSPDSSKHYVDELRKLNDHLKTTTKL